MQYYTLIGNWFVIHPKCTEQIPKVEDLTLSPKGGAGGKVFRQHSNYMCIIAFRTRSEHIDLHFGVCIHCYRLWQPAALLARQQPWMQAPSVSSSLTEGASQGCLERAPSARKEVRPRTSSCSLPSRYTFSQWCQPRWWGNQTWCWQLWWKVVYGEDLSWLVSTATAGAAWEERPVKCLFNESNCETLIVTFYWEACALLPSRKRTKGQWHQTNLVWTPDSWGMQVPTLCFSLIF